MPPLSPPGTTFVFVNSGYALRSSRIMSPIIACERLRSLDFVRLRLKVMMCDPLSRIAAKVFVASAWPTV